MLSANLLFLKSEFLLLPFSALVFICLHYGLFAANGQGIIILSVLGEVLEIISQSLFMLLLLLLAMGWAITRQELNCKILLFGLWTTYTILSCLLYVWMKVRGGKSGLKFPQKGYFREAALIFLSTSFKSMLLDVTFFHQITVTQFSIR